MWSCLEKTRGIECLEDSISATQRRSLFRSGSLMGCLKSTGTRRAWRSVRIKGQPRGRSAQFGRRCEIHPRDSADNCQKLGGNARGTSCWEEAPGAAGHIHPPVSLFRSGRGRNGLDGFRDGIVAESPTFRILESLLNDDFSHRESNQLENYARPQPRPANEKCHTH